MEFSISKAVSFKRRAFRVLRYSCSYY